MVMETTALRWFQQVADGVTVTEVSEIERITQSGVSRALARLEAEIGTPLLRRSGRTLRMTQAGAVFKRYADALVHELDDGLAAVEQLVDPGTGTVTVAFQLSLGTWLIPDLVSSFSAEHPAVRFVLRQVHDDPAASTLDDPRVDVEVTTLRPAGTAVEWHHLLDEPLVLALPPGHALTGQREVDLSAVAAEPFVSLRSTFLLRQQADGLCRSAGFEPDVAFEAEDLSTVRAFVAAGLGIAIVPALHSLADSGATASHPRIADPDAVREIGLAWSTEIRRLPAAERFRQHVVGRAGTGRPR